MPSAPFSRRSFLALSAALPWALRAGASTSIPVGLEIYSVRDEMEKDPFATVRAVAEMGYECVEFFAPYFDWTESKTQQMKTLRVWLLVIVALCVIIIVGVSFDAVCHQASRGAFHRV